jgi:hypothetical protein
MEDSEDMNAETLQAAATSTTGKLRETNGNWIVGAPTINTGDLVLEEADGRFFQITQAIIPGGISVGTTFRFMADNTKCMGVAVSGLDITVRLCSALNGIIWSAQLGPDGSSCIFQSVDWGGYLASNTGNSKTPNGEFHQVPRAKPGTFQQFKNPGINCPSTPITPQIN